MVPEPPADSGLLYAPAENSSLVLLSSELGHVLKSSERIPKQKAPFSDFSAYSPALPFEQRVHAEFGASEVLIIDGYINDEVVDLPNVEVVDKDNNVVLRIAVEPSLGNLYMSSDVNVSFG